MHVYRFHLAYTSMGFCKKNQVPLPIPFSVPLMNSEFSSKAFMGKGSRFCLTPGLPVEAKEVEQAGKLSPGEPGAVHFPLDFCVRRGKWHVLS